MEGRTALVRFCYPSSQMVNRTWLENYLYESLRFFQCTVLASFFFGHMLRGFNFGKYFENLLFCCICLCKRH